MEQLDGMNYVAARFDREGGTLWIYVQTLWLIMGQVVSRFSWMTFQEYAALGMAQAAWMEPMDHLWESWASNRAYGDDGRLSEQRITELWYYYYGNDG